MIRRDGPSGPVTMKQSIILGLSAFFTTVAAIAGTSRPTLI